MARLISQGIEAWLPDGWEGRVFRRGSSHGAVSMPVAHFATFALPAAVPDFGGGVPAAMAPTDIFTVLFEHGPESVGTTLFARSGMPRPLEVSHFHPYTLRRGAPGQSGTQWFFTEGRRPWSLYVVLGSHALRHHLVPRVNRMLDRVTLHPAGSSVAG